MSHLYHYPLDADEHCNDLALLDLTYDARRFTIIDALALMQQEARQRRG